MPSNGRKVVGWVGRGKKWWGGGGGEGLVYTMITHLEQHEDAGHHGDGHDGASRGNDGSHNVEHGHRKSRRHSVHNASSSDKFCLSRSFC